MKATGSKLIKVNQACGRNILKDVDTGAILVDIDDNLVLVKDLKEAFDIASKNPTTINNLGSLGQKGIIWW